MMQINEIEQRLKAALDLIESQLTKLSQVTMENSQKDAEIAALKATITQKDQTNQELAERLDGLRKRQEAVVLEFENRISGQKAAMERVELDLNALREAGRALRAENAQLRQDLESNLPNPDRLDKSVRAELAELRATHAAQKSEANAIILALKDLLDRDDAASKRIVQEAH